MLGLGWTFFALGLLGTVLPLVPTTPFMLLALWAFSVGSERFHRWLYHHPVFGPPLRRWSEERSSLALRRQIGPGEERGGG